MLDNLSSLLSKSAFAWGQGEKATNEVSLKDGENRFVGVLFADIKGFTAMSEYLTPDVLQVLLDQIMVSFSERVAKYCGYVDKYEGDRIMVHFGSLLFSENNARRAVYAGLEMIEVIKNFNQIRLSIPELSQLNTDLAVRVGVNCGMVATGKIGLKREGDFTIYGDVVNVASRMEEMGVPMKVTLPENMKESLEGYFSFNYLGEFNVKGKSDQIKIWSVDQPISHQLSRRLSVSTFIGREPELDILLKWYYKNLQLFKDHNFRNPIGIATISALAGMGKTRLLNELQKKIPDQCFLVSEISPVYQPPFASFRQIIRTYFNLPEEANPEDVARIISARFQEFASHIDDELHKQLLAALPQIIFIAGYAVVPNTNGDAISDTRAVLNHSMALLIKALAIYQAYRKQPLVIVFDDLHFIDEASLNCFNHMIRFFSQPRGDEDTLKTRILVLLSFRKGQMPAGLELGRIQRENIILEELKQDQIEMFIHNSIQDIELPRVVLKKLAKVSAGNPFYIEEWIAALKRTMNRCDGAENYKFTIPDNVLELVLSRLMSLDKLSIILLQKASAIGQTFFRSIIQKVDARLAPHSNIELSMQQSCAVEFLNEGFTTGVDTEYSFRHSILHQAVYDSILAVNKQLMHRTVAEVIEEQYQDTLAQWFFALEHHYWEAGDDEKWVHYLNESIGFARSVFMNKKALEFCEKLLASGKAIPIERILLTQASILLDMGEYADASSILVNIEPVCLTVQNLHDEYVLAKTRSLMATDDMMNAKAFLDSHLNMFYSADTFLLASIFYLDIKRQLKDFSDFESQAEELGRKLSLDHALQARLENIRGLYYQNISEYDKALEHFDRALEHGSDNKAMASRIYHNRANVLCKLGKSEDAVMNYQQALQLARFLDDEGGKARIGCDLGTLYRAKGDYALAASNLKESGEMAKASGNLSLASEINYNLACLLFSEGKLTQAHAAVKKCHAQFRKMNNMKGLSYAKDLLGDILYKQGKLNDAEAVYRENLEFQVQIEDREGIVHTYGNLGNIAADKQDWQEAEKLYGLQAKMLAEIGDVEGEGKAWYNWAMLDEERGEIAGAILKVEKALHLFRKGGFDMYLEDVDGYLQELKAIQNEDDVK